MITAILSIFLLALAIAITGFVYSSILTEPDQLLHWWPGILERLFKNDDRINFGKGPHPFYRMLVGCPKCVSGQLALWFFLWKYWAHYARLELTIIPFHLMAVAITIFFATLITKLYEKHTTS